METRSSAYRFGEYMLEPSEHRLTHKGRQITVRPKNFQVLRCLLENHGHLLTKDSLLNTVWPNIFVNEKVLIQSISELRSVLNDRGGTPRFIQTVPRVGYKFIGKVLEVIPQEEGKRSSDSHLPAKPSIAVLPFKDMSPDRDQSYFCEGLAEEIINALTHLEDLRVVARTSAFYFEGRDIDVREIGEKLNAYAVLEGAVRRIGEQLRISVQLVNAATGYHLWSEQYDRLMDDVFQVQSDIAVRVAEKLNIHLLVSQKKAIQKSHTSNLQAYYSLLKGRYFMSREGHEQQKKAADCFRNAIAEDHQYALAYATLSICYMIMWTWDYAPEIGVVSQAKQLAEKAVELDENLGVAHSALGFASMYHDWNWQRAERSFLKARELSPGYEFSHHGYAIYCSAIGESDRAVEACRKALELDPLSPHTHTYLGMFLLRAGSAEEAVQEFHQALELEPDQPQAHWLQGQAFVLTGCHREGIQEIETALEISGQNPMILAGLGWAYGVAGRATDAREILRSLTDRSEREYIRPYLVAKVYCGMGCKDEAFAWLSRAYDERDRKLAFITTDETLAALYSDARFEELLRSMGLPCEVDRDLSEP